LSSSRPTDDKSLQFLSWIISDGQQFLALNGYSEIVSSEKQAGVEALLLPGAGSDQPGKSVPASPWTITLIILAIAGMAALTLYYFLRGRKPVVPNVDLQARPAFNPSIINAPRGLYYDKTHTWAFMEAEGQVKVGVDDFLQHITGTLSQIKMKKAGEKVRKGEKILTLIREGKQLNLYSPVSGVITQHNQLLLSDISVFHSSPYSDGWVYRIEPKNWEKESRYLFMGEKYKEWLKNEFARLKEFFTVPGAATSPLFAQAVLQDGGELTDQILADLDPEIWEEFQTQFLDQSR
jgi:glycine cleavage system H lipoate-binding protein